MWADLDLLVQFELREDGTRQIELELDAAPGHAVAVPRRECKPSLVRLADEDRRPHDAVRLAVGERVGEQLRAEPVATPLRDDPHRHIPAPRPGGRAASADPASDELLIVLREEVESERLMLAGSPELLDDHRPVRNQPVRSSSQRSMSASSETGTILSTLRL